MIEYGGIVVVVIIVYLLLCVFDYVMCFVYFVVGGV